MKYLFSGLILFLLMSCGSQNYISQTDYATAMDTRHFTFMATKANPTNYDVINIMNSLPNTTSSRMLDLEYGYTIELRDSVVQVTLPYFGRMYNPSLDPSKSSYRFTTKDYSIEQTAGKRGNQMFTIMPHDQNNIRRIFIEVFKSGSASASIDANDRQPITYSGYIMKNANK